MPPAAVSMRTSGWPTSPCASAPRRTGPTSRAALAGRSTRPSGCGRPSRSFAPASIWAVTSGSPPACPARNRPPPPRQSIWPSRPSFRPSGTGPITRKTLSFTAASCSGSPNRSATASSSTSNPTPGWPAAAISTPGGSGAPSWTMAGCSAVQRRRIIPPLPLISCWMPRPPASTVRRSSRRRGLSLPRASRPAASRCG